MAARIIQLRQHLCTNTNSGTKILKDFGDGYVIRTMTQDDVTIVEKWCAEWQLPYNSLRAAFNAFGDRGHFYIGVNSGIPVASLVYIPWSDTVYFGGYFYVVKECRKTQSFGKRLFKYAIETLGKPNVTLCGETLLSHDELNQHKSRFNIVFDSHCFELLSVPEIQLSSLSQFPWKLVSHKSVSFNQIVDFDNESFVSRNNPSRQKFLQEWFVMKGGATYVALDTNGDVIGYASRLPSVNEPPCYDIGPLYARTPEVAKSLILRHMADIKGATLQLGVPSVNEEAMKLVKEMNFTVFMSTIRVTVPGTGKHPPMNTNVYAVTQDGICGF